jgi:putative ABC transport system substrate-binding protein
MQRCDFITLLGSAAVAWPLAAHAQQAGKIARVGFLGNDLDSTMAGTGYRAFISELQKLGFTEGQNLVIEYRRAHEGTPKAFTAANELGAAKVDVLVANGAKIALQAAAVRPT